jgi:hypothetical protein
VRWGNHLSPGSRRPTPQTADPQQRITIPAWRHTSSKCLGGLWSSGSEIVRRGTSRTTGTSRFGRLRGRLAFSAADPARSRP